MRQPAAFCGATGMKPTWGRVSRRGLVAFGSSLDQIGPLTRDARDAQLVLSVMEGRDPLDATSQSFNPSETSSMKRIGLVSEGLTEAIAPEIRQRTVEVVERFKKMGHEVVEVSLGTLSKPMPAIK